MRNIVFSKPAREIQEKMRLVGLTGMVALAMTVYFFTGFFNSYVIFSLLLCLFSACFFASKAIVQNGEEGAMFNYSRLFSFYPKSRIELLWYLPIVSLIIGYAKGSWKMGNLIDFIVIACCLLVMFDPPKCPNMYSVAMKLLKGFALFYAASIWLQVFLPGVYELYINALNNGADAKLNKLTNYYTGFTTSPGHTATYIALGMCAFAQDLSEKRSKILAIEVFLMVSVLFTGMRMPVLAVGVCAFVYMLILTPEEKRKKFLYVVFGTGMAVLLLVIIFSKPLSQIPVFRRTFASIQALINGKDATSGRIDLYKHALALFAQHPLFGIGWGNYKNTVVGVVTYATPFEVHNIFLQLLCETGVIGCACFVVPMIYTLVLSIRFFNQLFIQEPRNEWTKLMGCSCLFQIYFLIFGLTDNVLYYTAQEICYLVCCSVPVAYTRFLLQSRRI